MFAFELEGPADVRIPVAMTLDVQSMNGLVLGRMDRLRIRESIYSGELKGSERVRETGSEWEPISERPEFAEVFTLIGIDVASLAVARQQVKGWKRDESASTLTEQAKTPKSTTPAELPRAIPPETKGRATLAGPRKKLMLFGLLLFLVLGASFFLLMG